MKERKKSKTCEGKREIKPQGLQREIINYAPTEC